MSDKDKDREVNSALAFYAVGIVAMAAVYLLVIGFVSAGMNEPFSKVFLFSLAGAVYGAMAGFSKDLGTNPTCCKGFAFITFVLALFVFGDLFGALFMILVNGAIAATVAMIVQSKMLTIERARNRESDNYYRRNRNRHRGRHRNKNRRRERNDQTYHQTDFQ